MLLILHSRHERAGDDGRHTARAVGLVASLLSAAPAWRHVDPLPVLGRNEEEEEEWDESDEKDQDKKDDEHRAAWVLEERGAES